MELIISIIAVVVSGITFLFSALVTFRGEKREKKQATLDALNILQEQVFDSLNKYTFSEIQVIADNWSEALTKKITMLKRNMEQQTNFGVQIMNLIQQLMNIENSQVILRESNIFHWV